MTNLNFKIFSHFISSYDYFFSPTNSSENIDASEMKISDSIPSISSNGSASYSIKTSPPSWQSTTSTTSGNDSKLKILELSNSKHFKAFIFL